MPFPTDHADQLQFGGGEVQARWDEPEVFARRPHDLADPRLARKDVIDREFVGLRFDAEVQRGVGLGIEVQQADPQAGGGHGGMRLTAVVVFPTPPFWFIMAMERMGGN